jgi:hypothetical protein
MAKRLQSVRTWLKPFLSFINKDLLLKDLIAFSKGILLGFLIGFLFCGIAANFMIFQQITDTMMELF